MLFLLTNKKTEAQRGQTMVNEVGLLISVRARKSACIHTSTTVFYCVSAGKILRNKAANVKCP